MREKERMDDKEMILIQRNLCKYHKRVITMIKMINKNMAIIEKHDIRIVDYTNT